MHATLHDGPTNTPQNQQPTRTASHASTHTRIFNSLVKGVVIGIVQSSTKKEIKDGRLCRGCSKIVFRRMMPCADVDVLEVYNKRELRAGQPANGRGKGLDRIPAIIFDLARTHVILRSSAKDMTFPARYLFPSVVLRPGKKPGWSTAR